MPTARHLPGSSHHHLAGYPEPWTSWSYTMDPFPKAEVVAKQKSLSLPSSPTPHPSSPQLLIWTHLLSLTRMGRGAPLPETMHTLKPFSAPPQVHWDPWEKMNKASLPWDTISKAAGLRSLSSVGEEERVAALPRGGGWAAKPRCYFRSTRHSPCCSLRPETPGTGTEALSWQREKVREKHPSGRALLPCKWRLHRNPYPSLCNRLWLEDTALGPEEKRRREAKGRSTGWWVRKPRGQYRISHQEPGGHGSHGAESWDRDLSPTQSAQS